MTRWQRWAHLLAWLVLGPASVVMLAVAVVMEMGSDRGAPAARDAGAERAP